VRIFIATLRKLVRRPASFVTLGILIGLLSLILIAVAATASQPGAPPEQRAGLLLVTFPGAYTSILSFILGLGSLFAVIYGAAIAGSEWSWGTLKSAVARGESRSRYQLLSFAAIALMIGIGLLIAFGAGIVVAVIGANIGGVSTEGLSDAETLGTIPELLGRGWLAIVEVGALGFAIATLARSQLAGIGAGIAFFFGEQFATLFLSDIVKYMPFNAANAVVATPGEGGFSGGGGGGPVISSLEPNEALLVVVAWLVGSLVVSALFTERAEISG
jgi:ABC-type transport system involved in multi-copper enzyme maturation permease subunit